MKVASKVFWIVGGYAAAFLIALAATWVYVLFNEARQASPGMAAFSESLLFLAVFAVAAVPSTCFALFLLRSSRIFWIAGVGAAVVVALTGIGAMLHSVAPASAATAGASRLSWWDLSPIRVLVAPIFGLAWLLAAIFTPFRSCRLAFAGALLLEGVVFVRVVLHWVSGV